MYPILAIYAKRWHGLGRSGWWYLLFLVPMINLAMFLYLGFAEGEIGRNAFGADPYEVIAVRIGGGTAK